MSNTATRHYHKKSKLEEFHLGFEYNRSVTEERRATKLRTDVDRK